MTITCQEQSKYDIYLYIHCLCFFILFRTRETLASGNLLSVINVLMQLRKVCNHPNLFEVRPTTSPFQCDGIRLHIPSIVYGALNYDPDKVITEIVCLFSHEFSIARILLLLLLLLVFYQFLF